MEVIHQRCAGLDVHKDTVVACLRVQEGREIRQEARTFSTVSRELLKLGDWLEGEGCTHAAMEATGVYWKPVWHLLQDRFQLVLANAAHIRNVPGRKTDVNDATWIADLLAHGLIRGSFVPPEPILELRQLTRTRKQLRREAVAHTNRIQKVLEEANIKLDSVISNVLGASGRRILKAIIGGESRPEVLASLGSTQLASSPHLLMEALTGRITAHHRFLLRQHLELIEELEHRIESFDTEIARVSEPFRELVERLEQIPGVSDVTAHTLIAEIGLDMQRFPTAGHLLSWAGLIPRQDESAGKTRSTRIRPGAGWLKTVLVQAAWAGIRVKDSYLGAQYLRIKARRGPKKAIVAVAASMLTAAYFMIRDSTEYKDLGRDYFNRRDPERIAQRLAKRIQELGYQVQIAKSA